MMIFTLRDKKTVGDIGGKCAGCGRDVYEHLSTLDDTYNVWAGKCPSCGAINLLALTGMRGYSSSGMDLVLPTAEEVAANRELPKDTKTSGPCGRPADYHGSISGEMCHRLSAQIDEHQADEERGAAMADNDHDGLG